MQQTSRQLLEVASRLRFTANAFSPINQLPPEILCKVFFHLRPVVIREGSKQPRSARVPFEDLLAVTHTCQHWWRIATAAPELWSQMTYRGSGKNSDHLIRLFIRRSGELELSLDANLGHGLAAVFPHVNRLRTLRCVGSSIQDFSELCDCPAPLLETLHVLPHSDPVSMGALPRLFNGGLPALRDLYVNGFNPFPSNRPQGLSSLLPQLSPTGDTHRFWNSLFETLRSSPQLKELFLSLGYCSNDFPSAQYNSSPVALHALQRLHVRGFTSIVARQFLNSVDLLPNGIAMQFTNIMPQFDWMRPPTLPLDLSFHAVTSLEVAYFFAHGVVIQVTGHNMRIRPLETSDSNGMHTEIFTSLTPRTGPQLLLRELWIHIWRYEEYRLPPFSMFPRLEKLVMRAEGVRDPIHLLLGLKATIARTHTRTRIPCPHLLALDISGRLDMQALTTILRDRSEGGCKLRRLRLGKVRGLGLAFERSRVRDYVNELEIFDKDAEPRGMQLPAVCATDLGEWWQPWTLYSQSRGGL